MPDARRHAPLIFGLVTAVAMVAAILAFVLTDGDAATSTGSATYTSDEQAAVNAAATGAANLVSFRRAHFNADYQRAVSSVTGTLVTDLKKRRALLLKTLTDGKFDLSAKVTHSALVGPVDDDKVKGYVVLVSFNGFQSVQQNQPKQNNVRVTVVRKDNKWLLTQVDQIRVSS